MREISVAEALLEAKDRKNCTSVNLVKLMFISLPRMYTHVPNKDELYFRDIVTSDMNDDKKVCVWVRVRLLLRLLPRCI